MTYATKNVLKNFVIPLLSLVVETNIHTKYSHHPSRNRICIKNAVTKPKKKKIRLALPKKDNHTNVIANGRDT